MGKGIADKRIYLLINPQAAGGAARSWWEKERPRLDEAQIDYFWDFTEASGSAGVQIRRAVTHKGAQAVVIVGGDGSLFDAVNGILDNGRLCRDDLILSAYPVGSGCDFARTLSTGSRPSLTELICQGRVELTDVGCCEHATADGKTARHYFLNSFDMGAGADTCVLVNAGGGRIKRFTRNGKAAFLLSALKVLLTYRYTDTVVEADGMTFSGQYIIAGAANGKYIGGGMMMFPEASISDGKLDLLLVERRSKLNIFRTFPKIYSGRHLQQPGITYVKASNIRISTRRPVNIELDGEVPGCTDVSLSVLPGVLPLLRADKD